MARVHGWVGAWVVGMVLGGVGPGWGVAAEDQEAWDALYIGAEKVGHTHIKVSPVKDRKGETYNRVQVNTVLSFKRGRDRVDMEVRYGTIETLEGGVLRLDTRTRAGEDELRTYGDVVNGTMTLILEGGRNKQTQAIEWGPDVRGPYAAELSLAQEAMKPGETRELKMFIPDLNQICMTQLTAVAREDIALGGGATRNLLRVDQTIRDATGKPMPELDTTLYVDDTGQILKSHAALLGGVDSYRTTKAAAMSPNGQFDILTATILKIPNGLRNSENSRGGTYELKVKSGTLAEVIPNDQRQTLTPGSDGTSGRLVLKADGPGVGDLATEAPGPEYLKSNPLINSDDPTVVAHTKRAIGRETDPWKKAVAIQDWVSKNLKNKNFGNAFASAKEVARNLEGDCTEHSVLTAAMCRAAGVPSRMVVGLVYATPLSGFGPHAWNEVFVNGRWVAIDATFNQAEVDATHIKLATSSLDGVAPFDAFLPVVRAIDVLSITPIELR